MKKTNFLSWTWVLAGVLFCFTACDDKEEISESSKLVSNLFFNDIDVDHQKIGGTVTWNKPENLHETVDGYVIYLSDNEFTKGSRMGEVSAAELTFDIPLGTEYKGYVQVVAKREQGEDDDFASKAIIDRTGTLAGYYILNKGNDGSNNASLSYMNVATGAYTPDIYSKVNGNYLGDSAQEIIRYGSKIYLTVTASNRLLVLDHTGKLIKEHNPTVDGADARPRCLTAHDGCVYVSYFYGHSVAKLDTLDLEIKATTPVGTYPEQLVVSNEKLYVANSGFSYGETLSVVNLVSFKEEKTIKVLQNPCFIDVDSRGDLFVISWGNYGDIKNTLQKVDAQTGQVTVLGKATIMSLYEDVIYTVYAQWGEPPITFMKFDAKTGNVLDENFIKDGTTIANPNSIDVDPTSGTIYISDFDWGTVNDLYIFSPAGKLQEKFDTQGYYTGRVLFWLE